jgi:hypothetical protein
MQHKSKQDFSEFSAISRKLFRRLKDMERAEHGKDFNDNGGAKRST